MSFEHTPLLENTRARLEPLAPEHAADLRQASADGDVWRLWFTSIPAPGDVSAEIDRRLARQRAGEMAPWAIVDTASGTAVGMTSFCSLDALNRRLEIGYTWLRPSAQGTGINPAAKLLLLERAFDELGCIAVQFCTHWHNHASRQAIARLGAKQDGVLRSHRIMPDGHVRDTVVFSILAGEWPAVRRGLEARVERAR
ncbi:GNAT family N-acetyltransferase [Microbacterium excoecariae]|uniref:GNAT family N-acetyltransferase n=1 Tax=Microbacterium excoecariae TaxID=2715210 RepID=UPI001F111E50|nr:GNAT family protein [Microbacterium excoecariae]NHI17324.1 GNAT family N-acetyltransferase [Microbacterium excoecariae]